MSSYYRHNAKGSVTGCWTCVGPVAIRPSTLPPGEFEVEISDELAAEIQANGLAAYTHEILSNRPSPVPQSISPWQARKAFRAMGVYEAFREELANAPEEIQEAAEYATEIRRTDAVLLAFVQSKGWSDQQVDDFFRLADTL